MDIFTLPTHEMSSLTPLIYLFIYLLFLILFHLSPKSLSPNYLSLQCSVIYIHVSIIYICMSYSIYMFCYIYIYIYFYTCTYIYCSSTLPTHEMAKLRSSPPWSRHHHEITHKLTATHRKSIPAKERPTMATTNRRSSTIFIIIKLHQKHPIPGMPPPRAPSSSSTPMSTITEASNQSPWPSFNFSVTGPHHHWKTTSPSTNNHCYAPPSPVKLTTDHL